MGLVLICEGRSSLSETLIGSERLVFEMLVNYREIEVDARGVQSGVVGFDWGSETGCFCHIFLEDYCVARCSLVVTKLCYMAESENLVEFNLSGQMGLNQFCLPPLFSFFFSPDIHCDGSLRDSAMDENVTVEDEDQVSEHIPECKWNKELDYILEHTGSHSLLGIILSFPFSVIFVRLLTHQVFKFQRWIRNLTSELIIVMLLVSSSSYSPFGSLCSLLPSEFLNNTFIPMIVDNGNGGLWSFSFLLEPRGPPIGWLVPREIFPTEIRLGAQSINVSVNMIVTFIVAQSFPTMLCHLKFDLFLFFAFWVVVMTISMCFFLLETKNTPIEEMHPLPKPHRRPPAPAAAYYSSGHSRRRADDMIALLDCSKELMSLYLQNFEPVKMGVKKEDGSLSKIMPPEEQEILDEMDVKVKKYLRGESANFEALRDKKLKGQLSVKEELYGKSAKAAAKIEKWLMPSEGGYLEAEGIEKTWRIKQEAIVREVDISSSKNQYDIVLPDLGPYTLDFTSSGRYMAVAGRKGHLAIIDMMNMGLIKELQVRETVRDVVFLHNELFFAAAQKKYTYIYNRDGTELHCLKVHGAVSKLQFLKNHFLLASINKFGQLHYQDVTTGLMVGNFRTGLGSSDVMQVNPFNSVVALGHSNGSVTMWKPTSAAPLVKMLTHHGPVSALSFHSNGHLMATAGTDRKIKIWDLRKFEVLQTLPGHAKTLDFSQKGLLATSTGSFVQILGDFSGSQNYSRYMTHSIAKGYQIRKVLFRPYEDVLGLGHSMGWSSILIPGSGEPNFDSWVANPFETPKQRREKEVRSLLDKLPPETIMLDPRKIGNLRPPIRRKEKPSKEEREAEMEAAVADAKNTVSTKRKTKGRSKPSRRAKKMQEAVERAKRPFLEQQKQEEELSKNKKQKISEQSELPKSLQRFVSKKAAS
ncbi:hypothetical protein RHMOL_Rhmol02G0268100 [Rhododendron molle]|uniref:Uncharacterized protein n=1 Tax=Rhododendron molle TaxID=49168 RepID=A0ACC0PUC4_RHOML|nr:hypothetical protein RHMOL_Rhmol02G0268100 [Rhododendron molle]